MKTPFHFSEATERKAAFTRIELLVIVMVMAMLTSFVAAGIRGATNQVKIAECAGNLRQFAISHLLYANDNFDKLPIQANGAGFWPWDFAANAASIMNQYGTSWQVMYCPGTAPRFQPTNNLQLYNYGGTSFHVIGYIPTLASLSGSPLNTTNLNFSIIPQPINNSPGPGILPPPPAAKRVLIADANLTSGGSYTFVSGGYPKPHLCPHLNGALPAGGNLAMLDGHVEWRPFSQMGVRTVAYSGPSFLY
jgi:prepilin-type processing-associated H-X9-DG protein